jgi:ABC-type dipeptide/oligopeptide/nickel transport system permease subunit
VVPYFPFFILLLLGTALLFAVRIFSKRPDATLYKTGFSALVLIIGGVVTGTDEAGSEIWMRIIQVMTAVFYVVAASAIIDVVKTQSLKRKERKQLKNNIAKR